MKRQSLNGSWQFRKIGEPGWFPAQVPGGVHTDLLALGKIPDPFVADHELEVQWVAETDWEYEKRFLIDRDLFNEEHICLVCEGIDTIADVYLNEQHLGHTENMFRIWEWDVKPYLLPGDNTLRVVFGAPVRFIKERQAVLPLVGGGDIPGGPHLRKAPCHWGWDWGPKLPPIGLWKDVTLAGWSSARFQNVHLRQAVVNGQARVFAEVHGNTWQAGEMVAFLRLTSPTGEVYTCEQNLLCTGEGEIIFDELTVTVDDPQLWWPNGYGEPSLYRIKLQFSAGGKISDDTTFLFGIRKVATKAVNVNGSWRRDFYVNGQRIHITGGAWVPDMMLNRDSVRYDYEFRLCRNSNINLVRIWGGGVTPGDEFWDAADRYGMLVWSDFWITGDTQAIEGNAPLDMWTMTISNSISTWLDPEGKVTDLVLDASNGDLTWTTANRWKTTPPLPIAPGVNELTFAAFDSLLFPDDLYGRPLLGTGEDLMKLPEPEIAAFRRAYYVPNNAVLAIVGDIDAGRARELVARYFETVPPGAYVPTPPRPVFDRPNDAVVRTARIGTDGAGFHMGYRFFPFQPGEIYALRVLEYLLAEGETSRLRDRLVHKDRLARHFSVSVDSRLSIAALKFFCLGNNRVMAERSQRAILSELDKLRTNAVSLDEINRAKRRFKRDYLDRLSTNLGKALFLVDAVFAGAPLDDLGAEMERYLAVGPPSVQAFVAKYFIPQNRVVLELEGR